MTRIIIYSIITLCLFVDLEVHAQSHVTKQPARVVKYNQNVNQPLNFKELGFIKEVYGDYAEKDILNRPQRLKDVKNILRNRVEIVNISNPNDQKPCKLLSEVPLFDAYVDNLKRDVVFNKNTFNPLKYVFDFYSRGGAIYKVDNTNYFITIKSQHQ